MNKIILKFFLMLSLFIGTWGLLRQINFVKLLNVESLSEEAETEIGDFIWDYLQPSQNEIENDTIKEHIDSLLNKICVSNQLNPNNFKLHIIKDDEPNAFALPAHRIVFHHSLILNCSKPEEFCAILAHEIAHIKHNHVMKKLRQELGISVLLSISQNGMGNGLAGQVAGLLSGNAYSRKYEREADATAVDFLINAEIDPEHFANILNQIASDDSGLWAETEWISTHPETKKRCQKIMHLKKQNFSTSSQIISAEKWALIQDLLKSNSTIQ